PERLAQIEGRGRGRLLHPESELSQLSVVSDQSSAARERDGVEFVHEGQAPVLRVRDLKVHFPIKKGFFQRVVGHVKAVDGDSFNVYRGQTLGLVGESGCGKTTTGRAILRLIPITAGTVEFDGEDWTKKSGAELRRIRRKVQIVFQDPYASLNPRLTVE